VRIPSALVRGNIVSSPARPPATARATVDYGLVRGLYSPDSALANWNLDCDRPPRLARRARARRRVADREGLVSEPLRETTRPRLSIATPCFNEAEGIADVIADWNRILDGVSFASEIVVCNDGSTDGTAEILADLARRHPRLRVVSLARNGGYGRALSAAVNATHGDFVATIDSDGQFDVADVLRLLAVAETGECDFVTGYRRQKQDTPVRVFANHGLRLLVRLLFGVSLRDTNCAIKVARADVLRGLPIEAASWATPTEICLRCHARGHSIREMAVEHRHRPAGRSKLQTFGAAWGFVRYLLYMRIKLNLYRSGILSEP
jgi:glycosyltransferase involved in cell wall biosynthesis